MRFLALIVCLTLACTVNIRAADAPRLELKPGDRVAFVGGTQVEREQVGGFIQTMLVSRFPQVAFRNLGYSADSPNGAARGLCIGWSAFEGPDQGFQRLVKLVVEYKPTVFIANYGMTESFGGAAQLPEFVASYSKMMDALSAAAGSAPRWVLLSPNYHEDLGRPLPDPTEHNKNLKAYADAIATIATERHALYVDLFDLTKEAAKDGPLTSNGIHLTPYGYWRTALALEQGLGVAPRNWHVTLNDKGDASADGTRVSAAKVSPSGARFTATDSLLAPPPPPAESPRSILDGSVVVRGDGRLLQVQGLPSGTYELKANNVVLAKASADQWAKGVQIRPPGQVEALRQAIVAKDFDFFNYQRPENDSYILAFRKHEQGKNAVEIPEFLPLVEKKEKKIAALRVPNPVVYSLDVVK